MKMDNGDDYKIQAFACPQDKKLFFDGHSLYYDDEGFHCPECGTLLLPIEADAVESSWIIKEIHLNLIKGWLIKDEDMIKFEAYSVEEKAKDDLDELDHKILDMVKANPEGIEQCAINWELEDESAAKLYHRIKSLASMGLLKRVSARNHVICYPIT